MRTYVARCACDENVAKWGGGGGALGFVAREHQRAHRGVDDITLQIDGDVEVEVVLTHSTRRVHRYMF